MTDREYVIATNTAKLTQARNIVRDCLPGTEFGLPKKDHIALMRLLEDAVKHGYSLIHLTESRKKNMPGRSHKPHPGLSGE